MRFIDSVNEADNKFAVTTRQLLNRQVAGHQSIRFGIAAAEGLAQLAPGTLYAAQYDLAHLPGTATNVLIASGTGAAMRIVFPEAGAARLLVSATLGLSAVTDLIAPFVDAYHDVSHAKSLVSINESGAKLGRSLGRFTVDSVIGTAAGCKAENLTKSALAAGLGHADYLQFEYAKQEFWSKTSAPLIKYLRSPVACIDRAVLRLSNRMHGTQGVQLTLAEKLNRVQAAGKSISKQVDNEGFYKYGPLNSSGQRIDFSDYLDGLLEKAGVKAGRDDGGPGKVNNSHKHNEFSAANMSLLAAVARKEQQRYNSSMVQLADIQDNLKAPIFSISDSTRSGALLDKEYSLSTEQLCDLIAGIRSKTDLNNVGFILDIHAKSAAQDELKLDTIRHLNLFAQELHDTFINGLQKAGVSHRVLSGAGSLPSRVAITNDHGAGNFTLPKIPGVIERPVTVIPRNQNELVSVLAGINRHEMIGHDHIWGDLARLPDELRNVVLPQAIRNAVQATRLKDVEINVPGLGLMKKSEFFLKAIQAQANENISDLIGTASGGADGALSLGLLLQSVRRDGLLETGNFLGSRFIDYIEPHGIDRCRIKWCAEQMRQLAPHDPAVLKQAHVLDLYAGRASRSGRYYIWASEDSPGQIAISMKEWDALIPHMVKAQLDTPLQSLEGKRLRDILPDMSKTVSRIETLASYMERDLKSGKGSLAAVFDPGLFSIGEVFAAGLRTWMHLTANGADPEESLLNVSRLSNNLRNLYLNNKGGTESKSIHAHALSCVFTPILASIIGPFGNLPEKSRPEAMQLAHRICKIAPAAAYILSDDIMADDIAARHRASRPGILVHR